MGTTASTRILLGLDAGEAPEASIALAARLAAALRAAIHGLLVEEQDLIDAAALPFTRIISRKGTAAPDFSTVALTRSLELAERGCRDMLCAMAQPAHIPWTMQRERGELGAALSARVEAGDIVIMPQAGGHRRAQADIRLMSRRARAVVMVRRSRRSASVASGPVVVLDSGERSGAGAIPLAAQLASGMGRTLHVIVIAGTAAEAEAIEHRARAAVTPGAGIRFHRESASHTEAIARQLRMLAPSLVVADIEAALLRNDDTLLELQRASSAPLLLLGSAAPEATQ